MQVYKTTCLANNKIYIGQNVNDEPNYLGSGFLLKRAIAKYGKDNFKKEILDECCPLEELNQKEIHWISFYNSTNKKIGYNITAGGNGQLGVKGKDNKLFGRKRPEHAKLMSKRMKGKNNPMYGKYGKLSSQWQEPTKEELQIIASMITAYVSLNKIAKKINRKKVTALRWLQEYLPNEYAIYNTQTIDFRSDDNIKIIKNLRTKASKFSKTGLNGYHGIAFDLNKMFDLKGDYRVSYKVIQNIIKEGLLEE